MVVPMAAAARGGVGAAGVRILLVPLRVAGRRRRYVGLLLLLARRRVGRGAGALLLVAHDGITGVSS